MSVVYGPQYSYTADPETKRRVKLPGPGRSPDVGEEFAQYKNEADAMSGEPIEGAEGTIVESKGHNVKFQSKKDNQKYQINLDQAFYVIGDNLRGGNTGDPIAFEQIQHDAFLARFSDLKNALEEKLKSDEEQLTGLNERIDELMETHTGTKTELNTKLDSYMQLASMLKKHLKESREMALSYNSLIEPPTGMAV